MDDLERLSNGFKMIVGDRVDYDSEAATYAVESKEGVVDSKAAETLRKVLEQHARGFQAIGGNIGSWIMEEFILRQGFTCEPQPLPARYSRMAAKMCFSNAGYLVKRQRKHNPALRYVEGFAMRLDFPIPIHHAWAIDRDDRVIDPTWSNPETAQYIGRVVPRADLIAMTRGYSESVFKNKIGAWRLDYMLVLCPELADVIKETEAQRSALG